MKTSLRLLAFAAAPLLYLPLRAAEAPPPDSGTQAPAPSQTPAPAQGPPQSPAPSQTPPPTPAPPQDSTEAPPAPRGRTPSSDTPAQGGGESLSIDNNISFPVDI